MGRPPWAAEALTAAADCAVELDVVAVADDVVELLVDAPVVEDPDTVEALPLVLDVTAEALDVAAEVLEVTAEALDVVAWDVVGAGGRGARRAGAGYVPRPARRRAGIARGEQGDTTCCSELG